MLHIHLLGNLRAETDGGPLAIPGQPAVLKLWAYLLLSSSRPVSREQLAFLLWPDSSEAEARGQLRGCLHDLREMLPPHPPERPWLLVDHRSLQWNPQADYWLDVEYFSQTVHSGADEPIAGALAHYQQDLLPEYSDEWVVKERARLRAQFLYASQQAAEFHLARGDYLAALEATQRLLQADAYSEAAQRLLMRVQYLSGNRAGALRQFDEYLARLEREGRRGQLSPETFALREAIAAGTPLPGEIPPVEAPPLKPPFSPPDEKKKPRERHPLSRRKPLLWVPFPLLALVVFIFLVKIYRPFATPQTQTLTGPQDIQSTWVVSSNPQAASLAGIDAWWLQVDLHDGRGFSQPRVPFSRYPLARINLSGNSIIYTLLLFNLERLPPDAYVQDAWVEIELEVEREGGGKSQFLPVTLAAYRLLHTWDPATATFVFPWVEPGLRAGSDYEATPLDQQGVAAPGRLRLSLKKAFPAWQQGQNYGIVLMATEAPAGHCPYWLVTAYHPDAARWPQVVIRYR